MRFQYLFSALAAALGVSAVSIFTSDEPDISVTASFPENNPFGHVVNGEKNSLSLVIENNSDRNVTLRSAAGSFHDVNTGKTLKNTSALSYNIPLIQNSKIALPYSFYSEFKPGELRLNIWIDHTVDDEKYRVVAYDSVVTVVEPEISIFDLKLLSTYLMLFGLLGGLSYFAYLTYFPQASRPTRTKPSAAEISAPVGTVTATGAGGFEESWIPEHHFKKPKAINRKKSGAVSSGDELSNAETSGTESSKKKKGGRK